MDASLSISLQRIGVTRIEAELISLLNEQPDVSTKEAVELTSLRQPEVSVGMRELVERGWVECEPIPRDGKGRPMNRYRLGVEPERMHVHYVALGEQAQSNLDGAMNVIGRKWGRRLEALDTAAASDDHLIAQP